MMTLQDHIEFWKKTSVHDLQVAESLFLSKNYDYCLFIAHLSIEKLLKAHWIKNKQIETPPFTHNLITLVEKYDLVLDTKFSELLRKINNYHIEARYPDFKLSFYEICTEEFTKNRFTEMKEFHEWLLNHLSSNL
jgi:HEPN domain-containing protein